MGFGLAEAAYQGRGLSHAQRHVLVRMALAATDGPDPRYWGGWKVLAHALELDLPWDSDTTDDAERLRANAKRVVARNVDALIERGLITRIRRGGFGYQAEYRLNLRVVDKRSKLRLVGDAERHPMGDAERHPLGDAERHPESNTKPTETNRSLIVSSCSENPATIQDDPQWKVNL